MGVRITTDENVAALFDSVSGFAFGPTFDDSDVAQEFLTWLDARGEDDPRTLTEDKIGALHSRFMELRRAAGVSS